MFAPVRRYVYDSLPSTLRRAKSFQQLVVARKANPLRELTRHGGRRHHHHLYYL
jgi:hypothetical protein